MKYLARTAHGGSTVVDLHGLLDLAAEATARATSTVTDGACRLSLPSQAIRFVPLGPDGECPPLVTTDQAAP